MKILFFFIIPHILTAEEEGEGNFQPPGGIITIVQLLLTFLLLVSFLKGFPFALTLLC